MKYEIRFRRDGFPYDYSVVGRADSLTEARDKRKVSGDIVVDAKTGKVVQDPRWLWEWEIEKGHDSYAFRACDTGVQFGPRNKSS